MMSSARWLAVGGVVLSVGALLAVSWLIYVMQSHTRFWSWPGTCGVVISGVGFMMLIVGFVMPKDESPVRLVQRGGKNSLNIQAGRDINLRGDKSGE
jgi:hypothetical protein